MLASNLTRYARSFLIKVDVQLCNKVVVVNVILLQGPPGPSGKNGFPVFIISFIFFCLVLSYKAQYFSPGSIMCIFFFSLESVYYKLELDRIELLAAYYL